MRGKLQKVSISEDRIMYANFFLEFFVFSMPWRCRCGFACIQGRFDLATPGVCSFWLKEDMTWRVSVKAKETEPKRSGVLAGLVSTGGVCCVCRQVTTSVKLKKNMRNSKPPSEHAPKPDKNAAPHHPRKLPNVAFWNPKRRSYYTAKATTRLHLEKMGPDASASNVAASATANHPRNKLQHHANASKAAACATVNHHQNTPQNQTKTQRHTTHENCLTSLSEALKEEVITPPRQRPDCIWRRWVQMHLHPM